MGIFYLRIQLIVIDPREMKIFNTLFPPKKRKKNSWIRMFIAALFIRVFTMFPSVGIWIKNKQNTVVYSYGGILHSNKRE